MRSITSWWCCSRTVPSTTCSATSTARRTGRSFDGVIGKNLSNPIPAWAEHGADRKVVPYTVATDMDSPNPDSGEEYFHTNTQLFNTLDDDNRYKIGEAATAPWNAPPPGATPTMDGFVTDYISTFTGEIGRQPTYDEYAHIMTGYTPEQLPVLNGIARDFGVFDHWFCEVPSQTFMNRSFWTAATSSGLVVNSPMRKWFTANDAETIFERLEAHGKTWKVYVMEPMALSFTGLIHFPRLKDRLATHFVPFAEFEKDAAAGTLPDFSLIEPNMLAGHGDYHPAMGRSFSDQVDIEVDNPSSMLSGEAFLAARVRRVSLRHLGARHQRLEHGAADRLGRTGRHLRPRPARAGPAARPGRAARRVRLQPSTAPATGSPPSSCRPGSNQGRCTTTNTATPHSSRRCGRNGDSATHSHHADASARTFDHVFSRDTPRNPRRPGRLHAARPVPRMDDGHRSRRPRPQHPRQRHGTRPHHHGQRDAA